MEYFQILKRELRTRIEFITYSTVSSENIVLHTFKPFSTNNSAMAAPIPELAPVTTAILSCQRLILNVQLAKCNLPSITSTVRLNSMHTGSNEVRLNWGRPNCYLLLSNDTGCTFTILNYNRLVKLKVIITFFVFE